MSRLGTFLVVVWVAACAKPPSSSQSPEEMPSSANEEAPAIQVTKERDDLVFTWFDATGAFHDSRRIDEIPQESRAQVLVRDLSKSPDELRAHELLYVADLRQADENGRYPCGVVSRRAFERGGLLREAVVDVAVGAIERGEKLVVVYTTSWCGVCKRAKAFLRSSNVPFVERDIEKDPGAEDELRSKALAAGIRPQGVPVLDVAGTLMTGFDRIALSALLKQQGLKPPG